MSETPLNQDTLKSISAALLPWYAERRRPFPWREDATPYRIWISEIMLQQTRIEAALPYFERFIAALPSVRDLAEAEEQQLLKLWEGLGYYSRVRNLQKAARAVMQTFGGELPNEYEQLMSLPGIGEYTAGAIASIAFGQAVPAVDGNVLRVTARLLNDEGDVMSTAVRKRLTRAVCAMLPADNPGDFNQAFMELGETVCLPNTVPLCGDCPLSFLCVGLRAGNPERLPTRKQKKQRRVEKHTVLIVLADDCVLLRRREATGLLAGMWELPSVSGWVSAAGAARAAAEWGAKTLSVAPRRVTDGRHLFSHVEWHMRGYLVKTAYFEAPPGYLWVHAHMLREEIALPSAFRPFAAFLPV